MTDHHVVLRDPQGRAAIIFGGKLTTDEVAKVKEQWRAYLASDDPYVVLTGGWAQIVDVVSFDLALPAFGVDLVSTRRSWVITCEQCGRRALMHTSRARYCSDGCRVTAYQHRKRDA